MNKRIKFAIKSWKGKRPINQDALACTFNLSDDFCAVVCDGVGSVPHSEHASQIVSKTFSKSFATTKDISSPTIWFKETLKQSLINLKKYSVENNCPNIATTIALLLIIKDKFYCYNIGDTRIYRITKTKLTHEIKKYSYDHNYKNFLIISDASEEEIKKAEPKWHSLTNYIDADNPSTAKFDANSGTVDDKTFFLLATDGLYGYVRDNIKCDIVTRVMMPTPAKLSLLMKHAMDNGSKDNVSGIIVSIK